ncbi:MAG: helix-turn-helix domain-containing protein [Cytophagales bacterium]|nr:helix-turn-helix domain-containing protein [Cytophagales bacterium]
MPIGYTRVSKSDGSQKLIPQKDERTRVGLAAARARGRPRKMDAGTIKLAMMAMKDRNTVASQVAERLGITRNTLYSYVNDDRTVKEKGKKIVHQHI